MPSPIFKSGKNSSIQLVSGTVITELPNFSWNVSGSQEVVRFKNSKTGTFAVVESTFKDCSFSCQADHDFAASPFVQTGFSIVNWPTNNAHIQLIYDRVSGTNAGFWDFPASVLTGYGAANASEGKPTEGFNYIASGAWVEPATAV